MKANILVLDDEESIRFSFHRFLAAEGHNVTTAGTYLEALARMDEMEFDLILADIILGDGWGIDILPEVMRRKLKTRVIIMTAYPSTETVEASFRMQAIDYLIKPLRQEGLLYSVNKVLHQMDHGPDDGSAPVGNHLPLRVRAPTPLMHLPVQVRTSMSHTRAELMMQQLLTTYLERKT